MALFVIKVREIPEGPSEHEFVMPMEWLAQQLDAAEVEGVEVPGRGVLEATKRGRTVLLKGTVEADLRMSCVRCLGTFDEHVTAQVEVLMRPGPEKKRESSEDLGLEELGEETYSGDEIVLDDFFRDLLMLEVPMNPSCGAGCPGPGSLTASGGTE